MAGFTEAEVLALSIAIWAVAAVSIIRFCKKRERLSK